MSDVRPDSDIAAGSAASTAEPSTVVGSTSNNQPAMPAPDSAAASTVPPYVETKVLATIETVLSVVRHPNADTLHLATVQGWQVVVGGKNVESLAGKRVIYVQTDSVMPEIFSKEVFWQYLRPTYMGRKVIIAKLRGEFSQGLILEFDSLAHLFPGVDFDSMEPGTNVTNMLGIIKFYDSNDPEGPAYKAGNPGNVSFAKPDHLAEWPVFMMKTDQPRLQANIDLITQAEPSVRVSATVKFDGTSIQWYHQNGEFGVCSRNYRIRLESKEEAKDLTLYRSMIGKYDIENKLKRLGRNISIQTEMYGADINGNAHGLKNVDIAVFDIVDLNTHRFLPHDEVVRLCRELDLPMVPIVFENQPLLSREIGPWLTLADSLRYKNGAQAEGYVVRVYRADGGFMHSFKVLSRVYQLKQETKK